MVKKSEYIYVQGKVKWFRHEKADLEFRKWSHDMYLNPESLEKIKALKERGLKNVIKKDDDGYYTRFSRPTDKLIRGKVIGFAPPDIFMSDGVTPMRNVNVGNGSDVTTKLEIYEHRTPSGGKSVAARWVSSRIDNLVPFDGRKGDFTDEEALAAEGLDEQPAQF